MTIEIFKDTTPDMVWDELAQTYETLERQIRRLKEQQEAVKENLISLVEGDIKVGGGLKVARHKRKGTVDYKLLIEDAGIPADHVEAYRKPETEYWRIDLF